MELQKKESYTEPVLVVHELLRDVTGVKYREHCQKGADHTCPN
jgi:hypothetical protein